MSHAPPAPSASPAAPEAASPAPSVAGSNSDALASMHPHGDIAGDPMDVDYHTKKGDRTTTFSELTQSDLSNAPDASSHGGTSVAERTVRVVAGLANPVVLPGTASDGRRQVYTAHAYSVLSVVFRDVAGATLDLDPTGIPGNLEQVSAEGSSVRLRNPHHENEPDQEGAGPADANDGEFTLTLDQFFRDFSALDSAVVDA